LQRDGGDSNRNDQKAAANENGSHDNPFGKEDTRWVFGR
jgi:hypothetical protein